MADFWFCNDVLLTNPVEAAQSRVVLRQLGQGPGPGKAPRSSAHWFVARQFLLFVGRCHALLMLYLELLDSKWEPIFPLNLIALHTRMLGSTGFESTRAPAHSIRGPFNHKHSDMDGSHAAGLRGEGWRWCTWKLIYAASYLDGRFIATRELSRLLADCQECCNVIT